MDTESFLALIAEILEVEPGTVNLADNLEELGWDSLADLGFISAADERFSVTVDPEALAEAESPADLWRLLQAA